MIYAFAISIVFAPPTTFTGQVVGLNDGDTLSIKRDGRPVSVRLHGIDCPESNQDFGARARHYASRLAYGRMVRCHQVDTDGYRRPVVEVELEDGRSLNRELVRAGMAWWDHRYAPSDRDLEQLQVEARDAGRGLWSHPNPIPPWVFRKKGDPASTSPLVGNRRRRIYHEPWCAGGAKIGPENRAEFLSAEAATAAGYRPGGDCHRLKTPLPSAAADAHP